MLIATFLLVVFHAWYSGTSHGSPLASGHSQNAGFEIPTATHHLASPFFANKYDTAGQMLRVVRQKTAVLKNKTKNTNPL